MDGLTTCKPADGYAYRYPDGVIRFNTYGATVNGSDPIESIPFYFGMPIPIEAGTSLPQPPPTLSQAEETK